MLEIKQARIIDPANHYDKVTDLYIAKGKIIHLGHLADSNKSIRSSDIAESIDASGMWLFPGLVDLGGHIPEPGYTQKGTIESETKAATNGGFTHICSLPDTKPVADTPAVIKLISEKAKVNNHVHLLPLGALTQELKGEQIANMVTLMESGAIALSNARYPIRDSYVLRRLMEYASTYDIPLFLTANNPTLATSGCMHEGSTATRLGLPGIPETAETIALAEILLLAEQTGARLHISQISCRRSVIMLHEARKHGLKVTADTPLANLLYTDSAVEGYKSLYNVQPPLRSEDDRQGLISGVKMGYLAISSNHRPHEISAKKAPFSDAQPGMSQYDYFFSQALALVNNNELSLETLIKATSTLPAQILGIEHELSPNLTFNACLFDPDKEITLSATELASKSHNHPAIGKTLKGAVKQVFTNSNQFLTPQYP